MSEQTENAPMTESTQAAQTTQAPKSAQNAAGSKFQPILLGSDINVYGMARAFHEAYGITSWAFAHFQLSPTKYSKIVTVTLIDHFDELETFRTSMVTLGKRLRKEHPTTKYLIIPCGDTYSTLLSQCSEQLSPYFVFNTLDPTLTEQLSNKASFYELCDTMNLPHPLTFTVTKEEAAAGAHHTLPFGYPVALKPADSVQYLTVDFEGRKKAYIINTPEELDDVVGKIYANGYTGKLIIQDFIPGDDSNMRVLNAYVDQHHRVRMMFLGHPLLEDPTPVAVGNYAVIAPDFNQEVFDRIKHFLEEIKYSGVANFDMKYDSRDGEYKLFEINLRQGRSSYFVTLNGCNLAQYFVEDLVEDTPFDGKTLYAHGSKLWLEIPRSIFHKYVCDNADKQKAKEMLNNGNWGTTLEYSRDMSFRRWLQIRYMFYIYTKNYRKYFVEKKD